MKSGALITLVITIFIVNCESEDPKHAFNLTYKDSISSVVWYAYNNCKEVNDTFPIKNFENGSYKYNCEDNRKILSCYHSYLIDNECNITCKSPGISKCTSDDDCTLCKVDGNYPPNESSVFEIRADCLNICPIAVNKHSADICLSYLAPVIEQLNRLCCIPSDPERESACGDNDNNTLMCEYHKVDCPYTKAVCNKEKGVCEGVKE